MALAAPLNVHWELTNVCNLKCVHCYQQDDVVRNRLPSSEDLTVVAHRLTDAGVFEVTLTGGEVLLVRQLREIVRHFNEHGIRPHITSNGMLVDDATADWISAADVTFQVSIDAADPVRHNEIRRSPHAFRKALEGVSRLVSRGVEVSFAYTALPNNLQEISDVLALAEEQGVSRVCIGEVLPEFGGEVVRSQLRLRSDSFSLFTANLSTLRDQYAGRVEVAIALLSGHMHDPNLRASTCTALERDLAILYDGWAYPCPFVRRPEYKLGNIFLQSVAELWNGSAAQRFRAEKKTRTTKHCVDSDGSAGPIPLVLTRRSETTR